MTCNTFDSIGSKFSPKLLTPSEAFGRIMSVEQMVSYSTDATKRYDMKKIRPIYKKFITYLPKLEYPIISDAIDTKTLTPNTFAEFISWAGYTESAIISISEIPVSTSSDLPSQYETVYELLEFYLDVNFAKRNTGNSCAVLVNKLAQIVGFLSAGAKLIEQLKNFSLASVLAKLTSWKEMLNNMVDELKTRLLQKLNNYVNQIMAYAYGIAGAINRFAAMAQRARQFLSDLSIDKIKAKIEEIVAKISAQFEDLTPEAIAHILMVICQLADSITSFMSAPLDYITDAFNQYVATEFALKQLTTRNIATSVQAGNPRMAPEGIHPIIDVAAEAGSKGSLRNYISNPNLSEDETNFLGTIAATTSTRLTATCHGVTITCDAKTASDMSPEETWTKVIQNAPSLFVIVARIGRAIGVSSFHINSAYRSPNYNASVGGAKASLHKRGMALDVDMSGLSSDQKAAFIDVASAEGIGGIRHYDGKNFTHIDVGQIRTWGSPSSTNSTIQAAINRHLNGRLNQQAPAASGLAEFVNMSPFKYTTPI